MTADSQQILCAIENVVRMYRNHLLSMIVPPTLFWNILTVPYVSVERTWKEKRTISSKWQFSLNFHKIDILTLFSIFLKRKKSKGKLTFCRDKTTRENGKIRKIVILPSSNISSKWQNSQNCHFCLVQTFRKSEKKKMSFACDFHEIL